MDDPMKINIARDGGPAFPVELQWDGSGGLTGYQTSHVGGWCPGMSIRDVAALEFCKVHLADLLAVQCTEGTDSRIKEAMLRGWKSANEFIECREFFSAESP